MSTKERKVTVGMFAISGTTALALLAIAVQFGVYTNRIENLEDSASAAMVEARELREAVRQIERTVFRIEARLSGGDQTSAGRSDLRG